MGVETAMTPAMRLEARSPSSPASLRTTFPPSEKPARKIGRIGLDLANDGQQVRCLAGMIEPMAAKMLGAPAATHVKPVGGPARLQKFMGETLGIAGLAGAFEAMDHNYFGNGWTGRPLRMDKHSDAGLGVVQFHFHRELLCIKGAAPIITCDGKEMGVLEKWNECSQKPILRDSRDTEKRRGGQGAPPKRGTQDIVEEPRRVSFATMQLTIPTISAKK